MCYVWSDFGLATVSCFSKQQISGLDSYCSTLVDCSNLVDNDVLRHQNVGRIFGIDLSFKHPQRKKSKAKKVKNKKVSNQTIKRINQYHPSLTLDDQEIFLEIYPSTIPSYNPVGTTFVVDPILVPKNFVTCNNNDHQ